MNANINIDGIRMCLEPTTEDSRSKYGQPVLILPMCEENPLTAASSAHKLTQDALDWFGGIDAEFDMIYGDTFRALRDLVGATIETDDVAGVCRSLGVPLNEPGIVAVARFAGL